MITYVSKLHVKEKVWEEEMKTSSFSLTFAPPPPEGWPGQWQLEPPWRQLCRTDWTCFTWVSMRPHCCSRMSNTKVGGKSFYFHLPSLAPLPLMFRQVFIYPEFIYLSKQICLMLVLFKIFFIFVTFFPPCNSAGTFCWDSRNHKETQKSLDFAVRQLQIRFRALKQSFQAQNRSAGCPECVQAIGVLQPTLQQVRGTRGFLFFPGVLTLSFSPGISSGIAPGLETRLKNRSADM